MIPKEKINLETSQETLDKSETMEWKWKAFFACGKIG